MKDYEIYIVADVADLSHRALNVLNVLRSFKNHRTGQCNPKINVIAQKARYSVRYIQYGIAELTAKHILTSIPKYHAKGNKKKLGGNTSNSYIFADFDKFMSQYGRPESPPDGSKGEQDCAFNSADDIRGEQDCAFNSADDIRGEQDCTLNDGFLSQNAPLSIFSPPTNPITTDAQSNGVLPELSHNINLAIYSDVDRAREENKNAFDASLNAFFDEIEKTNHNPDANLSDVHELGDDAQANYDADNLCDTDDDTQPVYTCVSVKNSVVSHSPKQWGLPTGKKNKSANGQAAKHQNNQSAKQFDDPGFPLQRLFNQCKMDAFEREFSLPGGAYYDDYGKYDINIGAVLRDSLVRLYYAQKLRLGAAALPRNVFFPELRKINEKVIDSALDRFIHKPKGKVRNPVAYLSAVIYNTITEDDALWLGTYRSRYGKPSKRAHAAAQVPDEYELQRLTALLDRQNAAFAAA
jgi:hypothetical protein